MESWRWCGHAHHFIGGVDCRFHLATWVGEYLVSTVGDYHPYPKGPPVEFGVEPPGMLFETMVFPARRVAGIEPFDACHGYVVDSWSEVDSWRYRTAEAANEGHLRRCFRWAYGAEVPS